MIVTDNGDGTVSTAPDPSDPDGRRKYPMLLSLRAEIDSEIIDFRAYARFASVYQLDEKNQRWSRADVEGELYVAVRNAEPRYQLIVVNKKNAQHLIQDITEFWQINAEPQYLFYRVPKDPTKTPNPRNAENRLVMGLWFNEDLERIKVLRTITEILRSIAKSKRKQDDLSAANSGVVHSSPTKSPSATSKVHPNGASDGPPTGRLPEKAEMRNGRERGEQILKMLRVYGSGTGISEGVGPYLSSWGEGDGPSSLPLHSSNSVPQQVPIENGRKPSGHYSSTISKSLASTFQGMMSGKPQQVPSSEKEPAILDILLRMQASNIEQRRNIPRVNKKRESLGKAQCMALPNGKEDVDDPVLIIRKSQLARIIGAYLMTPAALSHIWQQMTLYSSPGGANCHVHTSTSSSPPFPPCAQCTSAIRGNNSAAAFSYHTMPATHFTNPSSSPPGEPSSPGSDPSRSPHVTVPSHKEGEALGRSLAAVASTNLSYLSTPANPTTTTTPPSYFERPPRASRSVTHAGSEFLRTARA